jgi:hypothetical protein
VIVIAGVLISASLFFAVGQATKTVTTTANEGINSVGSTETVTQTTTVYSIVGYLSLTAASACGYAGATPPLPGGDGPCWGGDAYVFNCASEAATQQGCTEDVVYSGPGAEGIGGVKPVPNYVISIRYPFTNQTEPSWGNCVWTVQGIVPGQGYALCSAVNATAFIVGVPAAPPTGALYAVTFKQLRYCGEYNILPWAVKINGLTQVQPSNQTLPLPTDHFSTIVPDQSLAQMTFYLPSGIYNYTVSGGGGFNEIYPGSGTFQVGGSDIIVNLEVFLSFTCTTTTSTP